MGRKNRDINIFSMSSLDLFASALGVFLLLTIIFLPFFPNTGDSPQRIADIVSKHEVLVADIKATQKMAADEIEERRKKGEDKKQKMERELKNKQEKGEFVASGNSPFGLLPLDIVIAVDTTGSMEDILEGIKQEIIPFLKLLLKLSPDLGLGVIGFKDRCEHPSLQIFDLKKIRESDIPIIEAFMKTLRAGSDSCNHDFPEAIDIALDRAVSMSWRSSADMSVIVVMSDAPAYADKQVHTFDVARSFSSRSDEHYVSAVSLNSDAIQYMEHLANAGKGTFVSARGSFASLILLSIMGL